jgi:hypothetical protein
MSNLFGLVGRVSGIIVEDKREGDAPRVRITFRFEELDTSENESLCEVSRNTDEVLVVAAGG